MHALRANEELRALLERSGIATRTDTTGVHWGDGADAAAAWACFKAFAEIPASEPVELYDTIVTVDPEMDGDMLLFQYGVGPALEEDRLGWAPSGEQETVFDLNVTRQFSFNDPDGEYVGMNQLALSFEAPATDVLRGVGDAGHWGNVGPTAGAWIAVVERSKAYCLVIAQRAATRFWIAQSDV